MDKATRDFFKGVKEALRAFGRESDGPVPSGPVVPAAKELNPAAAFPDPDSSPDCPQCKMPWAFHPVNEAIHEFECSELPTIPPGGRSPAMKDVRR